MKSKSAKKILSVLLGATIVSATMFSSVSAMADVSNVKEPYSINRLGGGPSPSAGWTYKRTVTKTFSRSKIQSLYNAAQKGARADKYSRLAYDVSLKLIGAVGDVPTATFAEYLQSVPTMANANQVSRDTLRRALNSGRPYVKIAIEIWERPANGQQLVIYRRLP